MTKLRTVTVQMTTKEYYSMLLKQRDITKIKTKQERQTEIGDDTSEYERDQIEQFAMLFLILKAEGNVTEFFDLIDTLKISFNEVEYTETNYVHFRTLREYIEHLQN